MKLKNIFCIAAFLAVLFPFHVLAEDAAEEWGRRYDGSFDYAGSGYFERPTAIAVDSFGNVYVTGWSPGYDYDYATIKHDTNGNELWVKRYDSYAGNPTAIAVDSSGNVYIAGGWYRTIIKYDTNGNELWVKKGDYALTFPVAITADSSDNLYVTSTAPGYYDMDYVTTKYDANGEEFWVKRYDSSSVYTYKDIICYCS